MKTTDSKFRIVRKPGFNALTGLVTGVFGSLTYLLLAIQFALWCLFANLQAQPTISTNDVSTGSAQSGTGSHGYGNLTPFNEKLYCVVNAGVAWQRSITLSDSVGDSEQVSFDPGPRIDVDVGYHALRNLATELEIGFIINHVNHSYALETEYGAVNLVQLPVMVNLVYTQPIGKGWSVSVGGGVGGVFSYYENFYYYKTQTTPAFGFQGMAGIKCVINKNLEMGLGYKILGTTEYNVGSGVAYDGYTSTEYKSSGNLTQSILVIFTFKF